MVIKNENRVITHGSSGQEGMPPFEKKEIVPLEYIHGAGRFFSIVTVPVGGALPHHPHNDEFEVYLILSGVGNYNDNGTMVTVHAGDATYCADGEAHCIENASETEDLVLLGFVGYENSARLS